MTKIFLSKNGNMRLRPSTLIKKRRLNYEVYYALIEKKIDKFTANIIARRIESVSYALKFINLELKFLSPPYLLKDSKKAANRIVNALKYGEIIGLETDHDCDGQTSHAILYEALTKLFKHPSRKIRSYISHRIDEGYGLSEGLTKRILNDKVRPTLIITADNASSDEQRIKILKEHNIDVIVTDHHAIPKEGAPESAYAFLNPTQVGCKYNDPYIAGCMVAWLLMAQVKILLKPDEINNNYQLSSLLDFVAVGTIADCVSMKKSINNRVVAHYGMKKISQLSRGCWKSFSKYFGDKVNSEILGFLIAPLLNSDGRMSDALSSVNFLLSTNHETTNKWVEHLQTQNKKRKQIQKKMIADAITVALNQCSKISSSICIYLHNGHAGVHGIVASRIKDIFGLPTILFSPQNGKSEVITGSARSINGLDIKYVLDQIYDHRNDIFIKYGGHTGAAGLTIYKSNFKDFCDFFDFYCKKEINKNNVLLGPIIYYDDELSSKELSLTYVNKISSLEPYGREFETPIFCNEASICSFKWTNQKFQHLQLMLRIDGKIFKSIWFFANEYLGDTQIKLEHNVKILYHLSKEFFRGNESLILKIIYLSELSDIRSIC